LEVQVASLVDSYGHDGDEYGFDVLYRTHGREVQRLAARLLKNAADAEDASQTVFLNVLRALRQGVRPAEPRAWLLSITRNVCFSRHRATAARPEEVELDPEVVAHVAVADAPRTDDIVGALARMLPNQRTALILRDFRGVSRDEVADLLSLSAVGVETLLTRARTSFREELEAGDSPFDCAETRALVEQQLAGLISVGERHTLRTHLRHCGACATLARTIRSSAGRLASLFWPSELFSRLVSALSQAPAAHVVGAVASSALVASVAVPLALHGAPMTSDGASGGPASAVPVVQHVASAPAPISHVAAPTVRTRTNAGTPAHVVTKTHTTAKAAAHHAVKKPAGAKSFTTASHQVAPSAAPVRQGSTTTTAAPVVRQPVATPPAAAPQQVAPSPAASPAVRPSTKPRPAAKGKGKPAKTRHGTSPSERAPSSQPPIDSVAPGGAAKPTGPGFTAQGGQASTLSPALASRAPVVTR
jgi:RNA polymerase sigma-70 factor (ECF subfamily)